MLDVLDKCLIRNTDGGVKKFFDIDHSSCFLKESISPKSENERSEKFEEGTVVGMDKIKFDTYRVHFLLKKGFIQLVKEVPSRLPFLIPDKGWAVCTPTKLHDRVSRLQVRDKILFKVDGDLPQSRGSLRQRLNSSMFNDADFKTNNLLFPPLPKVFKEPDTTSSSSSSKERRELKEKLMSHIVSSTVTTATEKEEVVMSSKMKRSIPGDFRSSVEAGRTGKHGLTDPNDSTVSDTSTMSLATSTIPLATSTIPLATSTIPLATEHEPSHVPNVTITRSSLVNPYSSFSVPTTPQRSGECDVTSTRHTPVRNIDQSATSIVPIIDQSASSIVANIDQSRTPVRSIDQSQWYMSRYAANLDRTPTNSPISYLNRTDLDLTPVNRTERGDQSDLVNTPPSTSLYTPPTSSLHTPPTSSLHTPIRRRVLSRPAVSTITVAKTVSIPTGTIAGEERREEEERRVECEPGLSNLQEGEENNLAVSVSTESINVTDD